MKRFIEIFKDSNDWNEKTIIGFIAFIIMILIAFADVITGWFGKELVIHEYIYESFAIITLGCFGIEIIGRFAKK